MVAQPVQPSQKAEFKKEELIPESEVKISEESKKVFHGSKFKNTRQSEQSNFPKLEQKGQWLKSKKDSEDKRDEQPKTEEKPAFKEKEVLKDDSDNYAQAPHKKQSDSFKDENQNKNKQLYQQNLDVNRYEENEEDRQSHIRRRNDQFKNQKRNNNRFKNKTQFRQKINDQEFCDPIEYEKKEEATEHRVSEASDNQQSGNNNRQNNRKTNFRNKNRNSHKIESEIYVKKDSEKGPKSKVDSMYENNIFGVLGDWSI